MIYVDLRKLNAKNETGEMMMVKFKRYIAAAVTAFTVLGMPLSVHAALTPSENSATVFPAEGNGNCNDYSENGVIMNLSSSIPGSGFISDGTATVSYTVSADRKTLAFNSASIPIDYMIVKNKRDVGVFIYQSGGTVNDSGITLSGKAITSASFCYGLGNTPIVINAAPVLAEIPDQSALVGDVITFSVSATDDDLPAPGSLTITVDTLAANFFDNGDGTGDFLWTATTGGSTNVTFTVTDGDLSDSQTVAITVQEPLETADCSFLSDGSLDDTGISCPVVTDPDTGEVTYPRSLVCNMQLDQEFFGLNIRDHCCICNQDGDPSASGPTPLLECDPNIPAGGDPVNGVGSCFVDGTTKAPLEVTTHLEFNNDPYYCRTFGGSRTCWRY